MSDYFEAGNWKAQCYRCGSQGKASTFRKQWQGFWVCTQRDCWEPRHPQDFVRGVPDNPSVPWAQPESVVYVGPPICTVPGKSAIPGLAIPGCSIPSNAVTDIYL